MNGMKPFEPKNGARFHFEMPGSVQGFRKEASETSIELTNAPKHSLLGERVLALYCAGLQEGKFARAATPTFIPEEFLEPSQDTSHPLVASPSLYSGQTVQAWVSAAPDNPLDVICRLDLRIYGANDQLEIISGNPVTLSPGQPTEISWTIPDTGGHPIADIGIGVSSLETTSATVYLDALTWAGAPRMTLANPEDGSTLWQRAWTNGVNSFMPVKSTDGDSVGSAYFIAQNFGRGLLLQGSRDWHDYRVVSSMAATTAKAFGLAARVQGMRRFYALLLENPNRLALVRVYDDDVSRLAECEFEWAVDINYTFDLQIQGNVLRANLNDIHLFEVHDEDTRLNCGAIGYLVEEACVLSASVEISPAL